MFYLVFESLEKRNECISRLKSNNIHAVFHYLSLHKSPFYKTKHEGKDLVWSNHFSDALVRLPFYFELKEEEVDYIIDIINNG